MICAAWLHDVVEDTPTSLAEIELVFGSEVATLVEMLTDVSKPSDGDRATRKAIDRAHTAKASPQAKTIKLADLIENTSSIVANDPQFAQIYLAEKALLLEVLREGDATLWAKAQEQLVLAEAALRRAGHDLRNAWTLLKHHGMEPTAKELADTVLDVEVSADQLRDFLSSVKQGTQ